MSLVIAGNQQDGWRGADSGASHWIRRMFSGITVHAAEDEVDAEVGGQYAEKGDDAVGMEEKRLAEHGQGLAMQGKSVDEESDERPCLLGVPAPVSTP